MDESNEQDAHVNNETHDETQGSNWTLDGALGEIKKLREEAKENRIKRKEAETELGVATEKLNALESSVKEYETKLESFKDYDELKASLESLRQENKTLGFKALLAGKVIDTDKAIKLIEDEDLEEGQLNVERFLEKNQFLAAKAQIANPISNKGTSPKGVNTIEDLQRMTQEERVKFFEDYKRN